MFSAVWPRSGSCILHSVSHAVIMFDLVDLLDDLDVAYALDIVHSLGRD